MSILVKFGDGLKDLTFGLEFETTKVSILVKFGDGLKVDGKDSQLDPNDCVNPCKIRRWVERQID